MENRANLRLSDDDHKRRMTVRETLTEDRVRRMQPPATGRRIVHDLKVPGLCVFLTANGSKTFYSYRKAQGRPVQISLGRWPTITVDMARDLATQHNATIAKGIDPQAAKRALATEPTLADVWRHYLENHAKAHKKTWTDDQTYYDAHLAKLVARRVRDITRQDVQALHARIGKDNGKYLANRVLALLSSIINRAADAGYSGPNPARGVKRFRESTRDRFLTTEELPRFLAALDEEPNAMQADYLRLLLFTGARRGNAASAMWKDIDLAAGLWTLPDTKGGRPQTVYLHPEARAVLLRRRLADAASLYVFPSRRKDGKVPHMTEPKSVFKRVLARAGISGLRVHDLRRTFGSWQAATGANLSVIGKTLGHRSMTTTAIYSRLDLAPVVASVNSAVDAMLAAGKPATTTTNTDTK